MGSHLAIGVPARASLLRRRSRARAARARGSWAMHVAAVGVFALAACTNAWSWITGDRMPPGDFAGYAAEVQYVRDSLLEHGRVPLWCAECYGGTTNFTSHLKEYVAFPLALAFDPVLATNLTFLLLRIAAAVGLYALVHRCFAAPAAGLVAGYVYGFGAIANHQYEYLDAALSAALLPPFALASLSLLARGGARRGAAVGALAAGLFVNNPVHAIAAPVWVALLTLFRPWRAPPASGAAGPLSRVLAGMIAAIAVFLALTCSQMAWTV